MITEWEIFSNLDPKSSTVHHFLNINGTEHDARLIARKLKKYVKPPVPAHAPYVYSFPLPNDLDEDTLAKIREEVQEGIRHAQRVNEFRPGGTFATQLYKPGTEQEDKAFPTFITLDPSESSFKNAAPDKTVAISSPEPEINQFEHKTIDLNEFDTTIHAIATTRFEQTKKENSIPPLPHSHEISLTIHPHEEQKPVTTPEQAQPLPPAMVTSTHMAEIDLSFHTMKPQEIKESKEEVAPQTKSTQANASTAQTPSIGDILSAETKYDMFVDVNENSAAKSKKPAAPKTPPPAAPGANDFNIFEQKIKDQTCFIDVEDVDDVTQRITKKDLSFVQHADVHQPSVPAQPKQSQPATPSVAPADDSADVPMPTLSAAWAKAQDNDQNAEVLDPFEQLLAATQQKEKSVAQPEQPAPQEQKQEPVSNSVVEEEKGMTQELEAVFGPQEKTEKTSMTEQPGEPKKTLRLKRKPTPATPAVPPAPKPPVPPAPAAPKAPEAPAPAEPEVQEEVHRTVLRRRRAVTPVLEKTTTIDHSIEVPLTELQKHNWPLEVPLVPTYTLENMTISVNRFAHATAISVIDNPGKLYNPLVLHGASGTGKTHFLHAIGYALSKKFGQENVFITNGVRLSRGIQRYIMEGNIQKFEEFTSSVKALLIDDIHLISINEQNRTHLSKLLNDFRTQHKQIVITSKYPPENLAKLEELLNFKLDSGWISDLKQAQGPARLRIIQKMLNSNNINITNDDINRFFGQANMSLGTVVRSIRRVRVLEKLMYTEGREQPPTLGIFNQLLAVNGEDQSSSIAQKSIQDVSSVSISGHGEWGRIGFFYPQNHSDMMDWLLFAIQQRAKELGIPGGPELAIRSSYSTENIISSAFKIANLCDNRKLKGAVILGPSEQECDPSVRENFYDIITHMLEIMLIRCGVINFEEANLPSTYVKILAELLR